MDIERQIKDIGRLFNYVLTKNQDEGPQLVEFEEIDSEDTFEAMLMYYLYSGEYNSADNLIFSFLKHHNSLKVQTLAQQFYQTLLTKSDDELKEANFLRVEVYESIQDMKKYLM